MRILLGLIAATSLGACLPEDAQSQSQDQRSWVGSSFVFNPGAEASGEPDMANAYWLARMTQLSYGTLRELEEGLVRDGVDANDVSVRIFETETTAAFFIEHELADFVVIRGSDSFYDWIVNVSAQQCETAMGLAHCGYVDAHKELFEDTDLKTLLEEQSQSGKPLYITGHSLGGALATMMTAAARQKSCRLPCEPTFTALYTFGGPRVFADVVAPDVFADLGDVNTHVFRFANNRDPVVVLPSSDWGYLHLSPEGDEAATIVHIGALGSKDYVGIGEQVPYDRNGAPIDNHRIESYRRAIYGLWKCAKTRGRCSPIGH